MGQSQTMISWIYLDLKLDKTRICRITKESDGRDLFTSIRVYNEVDWT